MGLSGGVALHSLVPPAQAWGAGGGAAVGFLPLRGPGGCSGQGHWAKSSYLLEALGNALLLCSSVTPTYVK